MSGRTAAGGAKRIAHALLTDVVARAVVLATRPLLRDRRRVLLWVDSPLMAAPLIEAAAALREHQLASRIRWCGPRPVRAAVTPAFADAGIPRAWSASALLAWWDIVIVADHGRWFPKGLPCVRIQHGFGPSIKQVAGADFLYGAHRVLRPDGSPRYAAIIESSTRRADEVVRATPELGDVVQVCGSLRAHALLGVVQEARRDQTAAAPMPTIGIASTFGPVSLFDTVGEGLLRLIEEVPGDIEVIVFAHPNLWPGSGPDRHSRAAFLERLGRHRVELIGVDQDWRPALARLDALVCDHTSVGLAGALVGIPTLMVRQHLDVLARDADLLPPLAPFSRILDELSWDVVRQASVQRPPHAQLSAFLDEQFAHTGDASSRFARLVGAVLDGHRPQGDRRAGLRRGSAEGGSRAAGERRRPPL